MDSVRLTGDPHGFDVRANEDVVADLEDPPRVAGWTPGCLAIKRQPVEIKPVALDIVPSSEVLEPTNFGIGDRETAIAIDEVAPSFDLAEPLALEPLGVGVLDEQEL